KKSARRAALGDKHKTNFDEAAFQPPQQFGLILAPMAPGAGHYVTFVRRENSVKFYTFFSF
ncbi:hypothetical protein, partial [Bacillus sp. FDAARGOS_235]|uniref:hypothetical protein n=1 Tax=Bacillus sp. FDAARGOS_235 TaxID=1839798 RepID=UPI001C555B20